MAAVDEQSRFNQAVEELGTQAETLRRQISAVKKQVQNGELATANGISLLDVKYNLLLQYITHLTYVVGEKLHGHSLNDLPAVDSLIRDRVVLEKMKPIEQKLKYQIDKLIRAVSTDAAGGAEASANPYSFKPNPNQLLGAEAGAATGKGGQEDEGANDGLYRAPRMAPVYYDEGNDAKDKRAKHEQRLLEKAARSRLIQDLVAEYDDRPMQMGVEGGARDGYGGDDLLERREKERKTYEEENFTRLKLSKREQRRAKDGGLHRFANEFQNLNDFSNISGLNAVEQEDRQRHNLLGRRDRRQQERESTFETSDRKRKGGVDALGEGESLGTGSGTFQERRKRDSRRKRRK